MGHPARPHGRAQAAAVRRSRATRSSRPASAGSRRWPRSCPSRTSSRSTTSGRSTARLFIDMRLVEGIDLASVVKRRARWRRAARSGSSAQVAGALDAAHARRAWCTATSSRPTCWCSGHDEDEFAYLDRLRHRPRRRRADERARIDAHRGHPRHARLHGARAVREPARGRAGRRLLARLHAVRAAHRGGAVPRPHAGRDDPRARHAGSAAALGAPSGVAAGAGRRRGARDGQAAGAPLSDGGRAGGGGPGGAFGRRGGRRPRRPR